MVTDGRTSMENPGANQEQTVYRAWHLILAAYLASFFGNGSRNSWQSANTSCLALYCAWHLIYIVPGTLFRAVFLATAPQSLGKLTLHLLSAQPRKTVDELTRPTTENTGESYEGRKQNDIHAA